MRGGDLQVAAQANVQIDAEIGKKDHWTNINPFPIRKCGFFAKIKEIQRLCGGDLQVAAQANVQIDAEIGKKDHFRVGNYIKFRPIASPRRQRPGAAFSLAGLFRFCTCGPSRYSIF